MRLQHVEDEHLSTPGSAIRREDLQKITALAARLQEERKEQLSPQEVEAIGQEVGIAPEFMRAAMAQIQAAPVETRVSQPVHPAQHAQTHTTRKRSHGMLILALAVGAWLLIVGFYLTASRQAPDVAVPAATVVKETVPPTPMREPLPLR